MRKMKKLLCLCMTAALSLGSLAGCSTKIPHRRMGRRSERRMKKAEEKKGYADGGSDQRAPVPYHL